MTTVEVALGQSNIPTSILDDGRRGALQSRRVRRSPFRPLAFASQLFRRAGALQGHRAKVQETQDANLQME